MINLSVKIMLEDDSMDLEIASLIGKSTQDKIQIHKGESYAVQMSYDYFEKLTKIVRTSDSNVFTNDIPIYKRITFRDHIKYLKKWYNSDLKVNDLIQQFKITDPDEKLSKENKNEVQKLNYIHALLTDEEHIVFIDPFLHTINDNIHLFHKMKRQLLDQNKSLLVVTSRLEDAFVLQADVMKINEDGLKVVETTENTDGKDSLNTKVKVKANDKTIFVDISEIEFLESQDGKVYINLDGEKFMMETTLQNAEDELSGHGFYRCHRSYIVNLHKVKEIITWSKNAYSVIIDNNEKSKIPLSRAKYNEIQERLITL